MTSTPIGGPRSSASRLRAGRAGRALPLHRRRVKTRFDEPTSGPAPATTMLHGTRPRSTRSSTTPTPSGRSTSTWPYLNSPHPGRRGSGGAEQMNTEAAAARKRGLRYGYHNHAHEFTIDLRAGGTTPWERLHGRARPEARPPRGGPLLGLHGRGSTSARPTRWPSPTRSSATAPLEVRQYHVKAGPRRRAHVRSPTWPTSAPVSSTSRRSSGRHQVEEYIVENDTPDVSPLTSAAVREALPGARLVLSHLPPERAPRRSTWGPCRARGEGSRPAPAGGVVRRAGARRRSPRLELSPRSATVAAHHRIRKQESRGTQARHRRVARQGADDRGLPRPRVCRRVVRRSHPRPARTTPRTPRPRSRTSRGVASGSTSTTTSSPSTSSADKKSHITKLKELLKDADELYLATDEDREGEAIAWHLLDELKPKAPGPADGLPRDHQARDPRRRREPARAQHAPRRGPGDPPHPRPPLRLRGLPGPVEEGHVRPVRRPRPVRRDPPGRRPGARADRFRFASYWDLEGTFDAGSDARAADVPGPAALRRRRPRRPRLRLRSRRPAQEVRPRPPRPQPRRGPGRGARGHDVRGPLGRVQALPPLAVRPVPHDHPPAGGQPQARHELERDDVGGAAALRERLHHLHAYRLHDALQRRGRGGARPGARAVRRGVPPRHPADLHLQGQERAGGARGDPARRRLVPHPGADRADRRPVPALRADLDAHRRLPDEGRDRPHGLDPPRRRRGDR